VAGGGILGGPVDGPRRLEARYPDVEAGVGLAVAHRSSGFRGTVVRINTTEVEIAGETGLRRVFPTSPGGFSVDGVACNLVRPAPRTATRTPARTPSGSRAVARTGARVARAARIVVEGLHDAELIEKVWGDDLRVEGIVVERLDGIDHLVDYVGEFGPGAKRRLGVLVDHLVAGSKEQRIARGVSGPHVLVTGTPYVDVWAAIRPAIAGLERWPEVPKGTPWKEGVCAALGVSEARQFWRDLLDQVRSYTDLETPMVRAVEQLIDFVAASP